jgi:hypothetical protein
MEIQDSLGSHIGVPYFCKAPVPGFYITQNEGPNKGNLVPGKAMDRCKFKMGCGKFALIMIIIIIIIRALLLQRKGIG